MAVIGKRKINIQREAVTAIAIYTCISMTLTKNIQTK
jgi:hypothetical protein